MPHQLVVVRVGGDLSGALPPEDDTNTRGMGERGPARGTSSVFQEQTKGWGFCLSVCLCQVRSLYVEREELRWKDKQKMPEEDKEVVIHRRKARFVRIFRTFISNTGPKESVGGNFLEGKLDTKDCELFICSRGLRRDRREAFKYRTCHFWPPAKCMSCQIYCFSHVLRSKTRLICVL